MSTISSPGIGSNLDVNGIVTQLMSVEQQPLVALQTKEKSYNSQLSAIGSVKSALANLQSTMHSLADATKYQNTTATSSDGSIITAATGKGASAGSYSVEVTQLAQAQKLASSGFIDTTTPLGGGTLTFDFGTITGTVGADGKYSSGSFKSNDSGKQTLTIDPSKSSLTDIKDAINNANFGVKATIINDGGVNPYRLVLSSTKTGVSNSLQISTDASSPLATYFTQDVSKGTSGQAFTQTAAAQNALLTVDGISVSKTSNTVDDVVSGLTLTLNKTNAGSKATVNVSQDTAGVQGAVGQFVFAYNQIMGTLKAVSSYNATTKTAAVLNGDASIRTIQNAIKNVLNTPVAGGASIYNALPQVGVTVQKDGTMAVDNTKLTNALTNNYSQVAGLFASVGTTEDPGVNYVSSTSATVADSYPLNITKMATRASVAGSGTPSLSYSENVDDVLTLNINGKDVDIKLSSTPYNSVDDLASDIQSKINSFSGMSTSGFNVTVKNNTGSLTLTSNLFGSSSILTVGGSAASKLLGSTPQSTLGQDITGTFGGRAATGSGQTLTGGTGTPAEGLQVSVTAGSASSRGSVKYSKGYAAQLDTLITDFLSSTGTIAAKVNGLNASLKTVQAKEKSLTDRLTMIEARYRSQFTSLDTSISSMNTTSSYLTQQLASLNSSLS